MFLVTRYTYIIFLLAIPGLFFLGGCATQQEKTEIPVFKEKETIPEVVQKPVTTYTIKKGDTVWRISKYYGVSVDSITAINQIKDIRDLKIGQKIIIPSNNVFYNSYSNLSVNNTNTMLSQNSVSSKGYIWPVKGEIISHFNQTKNGEKFMGISILPHAGQKIVAAKKGTVEAISALENNFHVIVIKHDWEVRTLYGGRYLPVVGEGNYVDQGQPIATFDHLMTDTLEEIDFKVYVKDKPVNPISYLP
ncbi:MAG: M23 family metallopeptidase [Candidatus Kuenenia sp.]|nr:M23 family metallopeptidase [Candidatus Kuenenia hertensis]